MKRRVAPTPDRRGGDRAEGDRTVVLQPNPRAARQESRTPEARLDEAVGLARAIDLTIVDAQIVALPRARPATYFGTGTVAAIGDLVAAEDVVLVCVNAALTPIQQRNLERAWNCKVIDRTGLILEIFGDRARTREGRLQVELAHLSYQRSRLVRTWTHLERQRGGFGFMGGPGETQIEADRRQIDVRIHRLKKALESVKRTRGLHRRARSRVPYPVIALVGYTNAGKSTLFNRLTRATVMAEDQLFATLDPTMRAIELPSGANAILSDTVGFVSRLPTDLVAAFRATLEEVTAADIVMHVRDAAHPDSEAQKQDVIDVLESLGVRDDDETPLIEVLNKIDLLDADRRDFIFNRARRANDTVAISAATGEGCDVLLDLLDDTLRRGRRVVDLSISLADGRAIAWLYRHGDVMKRRDDDSHAHLQVGLDAANLARFERMQAD